MTSPDLSPIYTLAATEKKPPTRRPAAGSGGNVQGSSAPQRGCTNDISRELTECQQAIAGGKRNMLIHDNRIPSGMPDDPACQPAVDESGRVCATCGEPWPPAGCTLTIGALRSVRERD